MPWLGFRKQQLTEELKLCDKVGHNVNLSLICVALQKGRGTTEERAVQRECRQPENSSLGVWDTFPVFSQSNSIWRGQQEQQSLDFSIYQDSLLGASFEIFSETSCTQRTLCFSLELWLPDRKHWVYLLFIYLQAVLGPNYCSKKVDHQSLEKFKCRHCK